MLKHALAVAGVLFIVWLLLGNAKADLSSLNTEQRAYVEKLHPVAQPYFVRFINEAEKTGWTVIITSGYRDYAKQVQLKAQNSKNASPGRSWHNYGMAIDINLSKGGERLRMASAKGAWQATGVPKIALDMGMTWGGNFPNYHDPVHFDISPILKKKYGLDINKCQALAIKQFGSSQAARGNELRF